MLIYENVMLALAGLKANKTRAVLTMLGIIIGIASVIAIMTIGNSIKSEFSSFADSMGADQITLYVTSKSDDRDDPFMFMDMGFESRGREMKKSDYIKAEYAEDLSEHFAGRIAGVSLVEEVAEKGTSKNGSLYAYVRVRGLSGDCFKTKDYELKMLSGRGFYDRDYVDGKKICMVSDYYCNNMFGGDTDAALGKKISVIIDKKYYSYTIVGVYKYDNTRAGGMFSSSSAKDTVTDLYIPFLTAINQTHNNSGYAEISVKAADLNDIETLAADIVEYMNEKFYRNNDQYKIKQYTMTSFIEEYMSELSGVSIAISAIAGISLLVGGIGVMNIMLVSITERTREIGTRKALGATNNSIRIQFIVESIVLCVVGGIIGMTLGIAIGMIGSKMMGAKASISVLSILVSFGFSAFIGIFFGYYPANKAAKMNPIDALRYE